MKVLLNMENGTVTAFLSGEIDHHTAKEIRDTIDAEVEKTKPSALILDFKDVAFMDSSGIGLIMGRFKQMRATGGTLKIVNASGYVYKIIEMSGVEKIVPISAGN